MSICTEISLPLPLDPLFKSRVSVGSEESRSFACECKVFCWSHCLHIVYSKEAHHGQIAESPSMHSWQYSAALLGW